MTIIHKGGPCSRVFLLLYLLWLSTVVVVVVVESVDVKDDSASSSSSSSSLSCVKEYGRCVMPRDCCEGLSCVAGDWQYTTDSTCLSPKSAEIEQLHLTLEMRRDLVKAFYDKVQVSKTDEEVDHLLKKYRGEFPKLVTKLEGKYNIVFDIPRKQTTDEL